MGENEVTTVAIFAMVVLFVLAAMLVVVVRKLRAYKHSRLRWQARQLRRRSM